MIQFTAPENRVVRVNKKVNIKVNIKVNDREQELMKLLAEDPGYTVTQLSELLAVSRKTVAVGLKKLKEAGLIKRVGAKRNGHWDVSG